jgi:hypothetical protein
MNETPIEVYQKELEDYTDEELVRTWNYLETCRLSSWVEAKMDAIQNEQDRRDNRQ